MSQKQTFAQWKVEVNIHVMARAGLFADDLPDMPYYDWFEDGCSPQEQSKWFWKSGYPMDLTEDEEGDFESEGIGNFGLTNRVFPPRLCLRKRGHEDGLCSYLLTQSPLRGREITNR